MTSALIVLGMQYCYDCEPIIPAVNRAFAEFDASFICQDFAPLRERTGWSGDPWALEALGMTDRGGAMLRPELEFPPNVHFVHTGCLGPSPSAFGGWVYRSDKSFRKEAYSEEDSLASWLRRLGAGSLGVCGTPIPAMAETARAAVALGWSGNVCVIGDACCGEGADEALDELDGAGITVTLTRKAYEERFGNENA